MLRGRGFSMGKIVSSNKVQKWATVVSARNTRSYRGLTRVPVVRKQGTGNQPP